MREVTKEEYNDFIHTSQRNLHIHVDPSRGWPYTNTWKVNGYGEPVAMKKPIEGTTYPEQYKYYINDK